MDDDRLLHTLLGLERRLGAGGGDTYREQLTEDALVVVPGGAPDVSYRFTAERDPELGYTALMTSLYVQRDGAWRPALHQQTPL